jgi:hypothetical protein
LYERVYVNAHDQTLKAKPSYWELNNNSTLTNGLRAAR